MLGVGRAAGRGIYCKGVVNVENLGGWNCSVWYWVMNIGFSVFVNCNIIKNDLIECWDGV